MFLRIRCELSGLVIGIQKELPCKQKEFLTEAIGGHKFENSMTEIQLNLANLFSVLSLFYLEYHISNRNRRLCYFKREKKKQRKVWASTAI